MFWWGKRIVVAPGESLTKILQECGLEVVALNRGSFEIALDLPRAKFETMDLGVTSVEHLLEGIEGIRLDAKALPPGYDAGVLHSLRDIGEMLGDGIDEIEAESRTQRLRRAFSFNPDVHQRVLDLLRSPISNQRTVEGRLLMADFRHDGERCRLHPAIGEPVTCRFDESLAESVYEHLRRYVRVTGEAQEDPLTGKMLNLTIRDIEFVQMEDEAFETIDAEVFWRDKALEQLASEQSVRPIQRLEDVLGKGADLWASDAEFGAFLAVTESSRAAGA